jgi:signal transduction histidine kinase
MPTRAPTPFSGACPCWLRAESRPISRLGLLRRGPQPPALQLIQQEAQHMGTLVSDLLDPARNDADPHRLQQCLAASTGPAGELVLHVIDRGPDVAAAEREAIFDRFVRGTAGVASPHRGSGIGLSVVRLLIEALGPPRTARALSLTTSFPVATVKRAHRLRPGKGRNQSQ